MIANKKIIHYPPSNKSITLAYCVQKVGFLYLFSGAENRYFVINIFSSEKLPTLEILTSNVLDMVEQKEKYQDDRLKHGFKFSILPLVDFPKLAFRIKEIQENEYKSITINSQIE